MTLLFGKQDLMNKKDFWMRLFPWQRNYEKFKLQNKNLIYINPTKQKMKTLKGLRHPKVVYYRYELHFTKATKENIVILGLDNVQISTTADRIFLPSPHVVAVSDLVYAAHKKIQWGKHQDATINQQIAPLEFEKHWIAMCDAEGNNELYAAAHARY